MTEGTENSFEIGKIVEKEWGREIYLINSPEYCAKRLQIQPGWQCSMHRHLLKDETFYCEGGQGSIMLSGRPYRLAPGALIRIPRGEWHSVWNDGAGPLLLLEISTHHDDADVERQVPSAPLAPLAIVRAGYWK